MITNEKLINRFFYISIWWNVYGLHLHWTFCRINKSEMYTLEYWFIIFIGSTNLWEAKGSALPLANLSSQEAHLILQTSYGREFTQRMPKVWSQTEIEGLWAWGCTFIHATMDLDSLYFRPQAKLKVTFEESLDHVECHRCVWHEMKLSCHNMVISSYL